MYKRILPYVVLINLLVYGIAAHAQPCGKVITVSTHSETTTRYSLAYPKSTKTKADTVLMLLVGGGGYLNMDDVGCPESLKGNSLVRSLDLFHDSGFITALVDAPTDYQQPGGLRGFRKEKEDADDLLKILTDIQERTQATVWVVGTSRGTISAVNLAANTQDNKALAGIVLTSPVTSGFSGGRKPWVADEVFDLDLKEIRIPILVIGHEKDKCVRTPPSYIGKITDKTNGVREQTVTVKGGPGWDGPEDVSACKGRSPHGFIEQEAEVAAGIARFIHGGKY